ncbi:MAG: hypothetical protein Q7S84_03670 [bacterium]|nr:hypothetical protein [bacterium]
MSRRMCYSVLLGALGITLAISLAGCERWKTFRFSFSNRTVSAIVAKIDGERLGEVGAGETRQFEHEIRVLESSPTGYGQTDEAEVTASAENLRTGKVTREMRRRVYRDRVNHFDINTWDFSP